MHYQKHFYLKQFSQAIQFSMPLLLFNPYIGPLSGASTPGQSGPGRNSSEGVLPIPQRLSITGTSPSDCLVSYPGQCGDRDEIINHIKSEYSNLAQKEYTTRHSRVRNVMRSELRKKLEKIDPKRKCYIHKLDSVWNALNYLGY